MTTPTNSFIRETQMLIEANGASESFLIQTLAIAEEAGDDRNAIIELVAKQAAWHDHLNVIKQIVDNRTEPFKDISILSTAAAFSSDENLNALLPFFDMKDPEAFLVLMATIEQGNHARAQTFFPLLEMQYVLIHLKLKDCLNQTNLHPQAEAWHQEYLLKQKTEGMEVTAKPPVKGL